MRYLALALVAAFAFAQGGPAQAYTLTVLHSFDQAGHFADGYLPAHGAYYDSGSDALFGTAAFGGDPNCHDGDGCGVTFALTRDNDGQFTQFHRLHTFESTVKGGDDGDGPDSLAIDSAGSIYGTTQMGGDVSCNAPLGCGTIYMLVAPLLGHGQPTERVLHVFEQSDGMGPYGKLVIDPVSGVLYGTTYDGGADSHGTVFKLTPDAERKNWSFDLLYSFRGSPDGAYPVAPLLMDSSGSLYGTTKEAGRYRNARDELGTAYVLSPDRHGWRESVIFNFHGGHTGESPVVGLAEDKSGALFGVDSGLCNSRGTKPCAYAFELVAGTGRWSDKVVHTFASSDGAAPAGDALAQDASGDFFGVMQYGGAHFDGSAYELVNNGGSYGFVKVYDFCSQGGFECTDGAVPFGLTLDPSGNLYGTASSGGAKNNGEVFVLSPER